MAGRIKLCKTSSIFGNNGVTTLHRGCGFAMEALVGGQVTRQEVASARAGRKFAVLAAKRGDGERDGTFGAVAGYRYTRKPDRPYSTPPHQYVQRAHHLKLQQQQ